MVLASQIFNYGKNRGILAVMEIRRIESMRSQRGFTLVEILIVIFIIVTVTAIAIPQFQRMAVNGT